MTSTDTNPLIRLEDVLRLQQMMQHKPPAILPLSFIGEDVKWIKEIRRKVKKLIKTMLHVHKLIWTIIKNTLKFTGLF